MWEAFGGRIAAVLSGGGARGAYEGGALLAFQDAQLPTHVITSTSVGSINAASYAAHSGTLVGNAESLVESWLALTPPAVGIEWTRYAWMLAGLIAASAGFGNLILLWLTDRGLRLQLPQPALTWFALGLAGSAVLLLHDRLPYLAYVLRNTFRRTSWKPDPDKLQLSLLANLVVGSFLFFVVLSLQLPSQLLALARAHPVAALLALGGLALLVVLRYRLRVPLSIVLHRLLRLPLRRGLFTNFERARYLRARISHQRVCASPIRVIITATDLEACAARFFSNAPPGELKRDPGVDPHFVDHEVATTEDLLRAVIASSALPVVYEPLTVEKWLCTDGGLVANQPIRPAIRLGADVLFLVMMDAPGRRPGEMETFVDVAVHSFHLLMRQNLLVDLKILANINAVCERAAEGLGLRPEEIEIDLGTRRYRFIKAFTIRPAAPLGGTVLDFGGETTGAALLQGYRDAGREIENFLAYARGARFGRSRRVLSFAPGVRLSGSP